MVPRPEHDVALLERRGTNVGHVAQEPTRTLLLRQPPTPAHETATVHAEEWLASPMRCSSTRGVDLLSGVHVASLPVVG